MKWKLDRCYQCGGRGPCSTVYAVHFPGGTVLLAGDAVLYQRPSLLEGYVAIKYRSGWPMLTLRLDGPTPRNSKTERGRGYKHGRSLADALCVGSNEWGDGQQHCRDLTGSKVPRMPPDVVRMKGEECLVGVHGCQAGAS